MRKVLAASIGALAVLWAALAFGLHEPWPAPLRWLASLLWIAGAGLAWRRGPRRRSAAVVAGGVLAGAMLQATLRPSLDRDWSSDQTRMPRSVFLDGPEGDRVRLTGLRHCAYRTAGDYDVHWEERTVSLADLRTVDFVVEPFAAWRGPAHTFLTFGFADGTHLAVSAEIRKERREAYSPLKGLFRNYELMYVAGDERDLIGLRANVRGHPVWVYPVRAGPPAVRALFVAMMRRANALAEKPEFYDTLTNTCTTNIVRHLEELSGRGLGLDLRILLPGYADALAWELGLIDGAASLEEARARFRINGRTAFGADGPAWSRQIRG